MPSTCRRRAPACKGLLRPDIVMFGEPLPHAPFTRLQAELERGFDLVLAVGCSSLFPYMARPVLVAKSEGTPTVEITPNQTDLSSIVDLRLAATPGQALQRIWQAFKGLVPAATLTELRRS